MRNFLLRFAKDDTYVTVIEYGLIASLIAVAIITAVTLVGTNLTTQFSAIATAL
jgi:pilus assembly protein Flp/PilA